MKAITEIKEITPRIPNNYSRHASRKVKTMVLSVLLRNYAISRDTTLLKELPNHCYLNLSLYTGVNIKTIKSIIERFLFDLNLINEFYRSYTMIWEPEPKKLERKVRFYLHKIHRLAPVFDYERARTNLRILLKKLRKKVFWPKMSTQICVVIFVTDMNDKNIDKNERLIQKNLRTLCNCSAYAFHRTRNILGINQN